MRILVCGGRDFDPEYVSDRIDTLLGRWFPCEPNIRISHGGARGADAGAALFAKEMGLVSRVYPADWNTHGKAAGVIRNQEMLDQEEPVRVIAFWDGKSKGTLDMITRAVRGFVPVWIEPPPETEERQREMF